MDIIRRIEKWQKDRLLDKQEFDDLNELTNILEELYELIGLKIQKELRNSFKENNKKIIDDLKKNKRYLVDVYEPTEEDKVDALFDICVFAIGAMMKLGYEPTCVFEEGLKEIESRVGSIVDGKFQKDTSPEAKAKWYKAQYDKCKKCR